MSSKHDMWEFIFYLLFLVSDEKNKVEKTIVYICVEMREQLID